MAERHILFFLPAAGLWGSCFPAPGVRKLAERIQPEYVTLEYITENREQLAEYLRQGMAALKNKKSLLIH